MPDITTQPADATVAVGATVHFTLAGAGTAPKACSWLRQGGALPDGATISYQPAADDPFYTAPTLLMGGTPYVPYPAGYLVRGDTFRLTISNVALADAGAYYGVLSVAEEGQATSRHATLTVGAVDTGGGTPAAGGDPEIAAQPPDATAHVGDTVVLPITVTGTAPITYEWLKVLVPTNVVLSNNAVYSGTATAALSIHVLAGAQAGSYICRATGPAGVAISRHIGLTLLAGTGTGTGTGTGSATSPDINTQPASLSVPIGGTAAFTVEATGTAPITYQWYKGTAPIAGATGATLTVADVTTASYGSYAVEVTNAAGAVRSAVATLTITSGAVPVASTLGADWSIVTGGTETAAALLSITEITRTRASQSMDTCTLTVGGLAVDASPLFAYGDIVTVLRGGSPWFTGRVVELPATGTAVAHSHTYTLGGPWWYLEHLVFTQTWKTKNGTASAQLGCATLGMNLAGELVTTGAVIREALEYATDAGAPFTVGSVLDGFITQVDQVRDVTCAEVIRKTLRWHPDAVAWFDYSVVPPAFHVQPRSALDAVTLTMGRRPFVSIGEITPRPDLQAPEVVIAYESTGSSDGQSYTDVGYDVAPAGATGKAFGAVVLSISMRGETSTTVKQPVIVTPIIDAPDDPDAAAFFVAQFGGELAVAAADPNIGVAGITIVDISRDLQDPDAVDFLDDDSGDGGDGGDSGDGTTPVEYDDSLGNMLVQGAISEDMRKQFALKAQAQRITFSYTLDSGTGDSNAPNDPGAANYADVSDQRTATLDIMATNAVTQSYTTLSSYTASDQGTTGLAANYLATLSVLQWAGSVVLEEQVAGATVDIGLGNLLNIAGSHNAAWATMNALIIQEQVQASTGRTTLRFGPSKHLTPSEMIDRLRTTRPGGTGGRESTGARSTDRSDERSSGAPSDASTVAGSVHHPMRVATPVPPAVTASGPPPPLTVLPASDRDHPGRVRVVNGTLGNLLPDEMHIPDAVLPDGTDKHCYPAMQSGTNYVYGKVKVDGDTGLFSEAHVYSATSQAQADGTYAYLLIAIVTFDGSTAITARDISQLAVGSQSLLVTFSADGTIINPYWPGARGQ